MVHPLRHLHRRRNVLRTPVVRWTITRRTLSTLSCDTNDDDGDGGGDTSLQRSYPPSIVDTHQKLSKLSGILPLQQHLRRAAKLNHTRNNQTGIKNGLYRRLRRMMAYCCSHRCPLNLYRRVDKKIKYDVEEEERGSTTTTSLSGQQYTGEDIQIEEVIIVLIVWKEGRMDWNRLLVSISIQQIQINGGRHRTNNRCVHKITTDWYYIILL